jgi:hypothetical protein
MNYISRVPTVLLRGNSINTYVLYQSFLPERLSQASSFDTLNIMETIIIPKPKNICLYRIINSN